MHLRHPITSLYCESHVDEGPDGEIFKKKIETISFLKIAE